MAYVGAQKIGINDNIVITYVITNSNILKDIQIVNLPDFDVKSRQCITNEVNRSIHNNNSISEIYTMTIVYIVHPRHTGNAIFPILSLTDTSNNIYTSEKLNVEVVNGNILTKKEQSMEQLTGLPFTTCEAWTMLLLKAGMNARIKSRRYY